VSHLEYGNEDELRSIIATLAHFVKSDCVALSLLPLAVNAHLQRAFYGLGRRNMLVRRLINDWQLANNLLRNPLQAKQLGGLLAHQGGDLSRISAMLQLLSRQVTDLLCR
jgi:hypothetical protein